MCRVWDLLKDGNQTKFLSVLVKSCREVVGGGGRWREGEGGRGRCEERPGDGEMSAKTNVFTALAVTDEPGR